MIREHIKTSAKDNVGYHRSKHNKPRFDGECSKLIDQRKQAKLQWLQNPSQMNGENLQYKNVKPVEYLGLRKKKISRTKLMSLKLIIRTKILEICIEA
jgi:hypothetical protein